MNTPAADLECGFPEVDRSFMEVVTANRAKVLLGQFAGTHLFMGYGGRH